MSAVSKSYWFHNTKKTTVKKTAGHLITVDFIESKLWLRFQFRDLMLISHIQFILLRGFFLPDIPVLSLLD